MASPTKSKVVRAPKAAPVKTEKVQVSSEAAIEKKAANRKTMTGVVVSDKMQKTIIVKVDRKVRHGLYQKYVNHSKRFKAHDEKREAKIGDLVMIVETRPMSKEKRFALQSILRKSGQAPEINI